MKIVNRLKTKGLENLITANPSQKNLENLEMRRLNYLKRILRKNRKKETKRKSYVKEAIDKNS